MSFKSRLIGWIVKIVRRSECVEHDQRSWSDALPRRTRWARRGALDAVSTQRASIWALSLVRSVSECVGRSTTQSDAVGWGTPRGVSASAVGASLRSPDALTECWIDVCRSLASGRWIEPTSTPGGRAGAGRQGRATGNLAARGSRARDVAAVIAGSSSEGRS